MLNELNNANFALRTLIHIISSSRLAPLLRNAGHTGNINNSMFTFHEYFASPSRMVIVIVVVAVVVSGRLSFQLRMDPASSGPKQGPSRRFVNEESVVSGRHSFQLTMDYRQRQQNQQRNNQQQPHPHTHNNNINDDDITNKECTYNKHTKQVLKPVRKTCSEPLQNFLIQ